MKFLKISIIVPVYNEAKYIVDVLENVQKADTLKLTKEIIVINDGSTDDTDEVIKKYVENKKNIIYQNNTENQGKGAVVKQGCELSTGDIVLIQDADFEYNPEEYPHLLEPFLNYDADVVYGSRFISNRPHRVLYFWHYVANVFLTTLSNIFTNLNISDMETGYKAFKGTLIRQIAKNLQSKRFGFEPEVTARIAKVQNVKVYEVGISYYGRTYREGKKIGWKDGAKALFEIVRYNLF